MGTVCPLALSRGTTRFCSLPLSHVLFSVLALLEGPVLAIQQSLAVLIHLDFSNHDLGWVNADGHGLSIGLVASDALHVNAPLLAVDLGHLALSVMVVTTDDHDLIITANWNGTYGVLGSEILAERSAHQFAADMGWRSEVSLARLAAGACDGSLH